MQRNILALFLLACAALFIGNVAMSERSYDAQRKADKRAEDRDQKIPAVRDVERRAMCVDDDKLWLTTYCPDVFYNPFTRDQEANIEAVGNALKYGTSECRAAPRGDGKSSVTKYLAAKYALYRQVRFPLLLQATSGKAKGALGSIKRRLRSAPGTPLYDDFPLECHLARYVAPAPARANNITVSGTLLQPDGSELKVKHAQIHLEWQADRIILPTFADAGEIGPILMSLGISSDELQGCNVYDIRPDFVMLDDLDSRDSLAAVDGTVAAKIETIIDQNVAGLGGPNRRLGKVMLCTIPSRDSVAYRYSDPTIKPAWSGSRVGRIKEWPLCSRKSEPNYNPAGDLWEEYITLRQEGTQKLDADGKPIDKFGRKAHQFYVANRAAMDEGAVLSNPYDYSQELTPDGSPRHISALQKCYDYIADNGFDSFQTEHQNDPPEEEGVERNVLTAYHIQHNCRSGLQQNIVPAETIAIVAGLDVKKLGFHFTSWAFDSFANGCCVEYNFHELNTGRMALQDVELAILNGLHEWRENRDANPYLDVEGCEHLIDLALIDEGWKHESWAGQPARRFCMEAGTTRFLPAKGESPYYAPKGDNTKVIHGDNWCISFYGGIPVVRMNTDHWKQKVHEGFLTSHVAESDETRAGGLTLFEPPSSKRGQPHMSYAKHITSEVWEKRFQPGFRGHKEGWWKIGSQNHYFDATYMGLVARSILGISVFGAIAARAAPVPQTAPRQQTPTLVTAGDSGGRQRW